MSLISVVMPAYNVSKYIREAINSIISQTYSEWELIIVDDCSTDNTVEIVKEYQKRYEKIRLFSTEKNSGGCRLPRFEGIIKATGDFISCIDSDDTIEPDFLKKLYSRQQEINADIVMDRMILCNEDGSLRQTTVPDIDFDMNLLLDGRSACKLTIGGWKLPMAGMLIKSDLYKNYVSKQSLYDYNYGYSDEIDHRYLLLSASRIGLIDARYYYRQQYNSIVNKISLKMFDVLPAVERLYSLVKTEYGDDYTIMAMMHYEYIGAVTNCQKKFFRYIESFNSSERSYIQELIKTAFLHIKERKMRGRTYKQKIAILCYPAFLFTSAINNYISCRK